MKKMLAIAVMALMLAALAACSPPPAGQGTAKVGLTPYKLTDKEADLLQSLGLDNKTQLLLFNAPEEALSLSFQIYMLGPDGNWQKSGGGGISLGEEREPVSRLSGSLSIVQQRQYALDITITCGSVAAFKTGEFYPDAEPMAVAREYLNSFTEIALDQEIPIYLLAGSGEGSMCTHSLEDYFAPEKFSDTDFVQIITVEFSDKA